MKINILIVLLFVSVVLFSCTENIKARNYGGELEVMLPKNKMLINATWKGNNLWYLYEDMPADYEPKTKIFKEKATYGIMEGTIIFIERN